MVNLFKKRMPMEFYLGIVIMIMVIFFSITTDQFMTLRNILDLTEGYAVSGIFALGLFVVLVTGGIDISFAAVASVVQYAVASLLLGGYIDGAFQSILLAVSLGIFFGLFNLVAQL